MDKYNWALPVVTFLPLAGALVMMLLPKEEEQLHKAIALLTSLATLAVGVFVFLQFDYGNGHFQFLVDQAPALLAHARELSYPASRSCACRRALGDEFRRPVARPGRWSS